MNSSSSSNEDRTEIDRVWGGIGGGAYTREEALKKHLAESEKSRKRQEEEAAHARYAAEEARREAEHQTAILAEQARQQEETAEYTRLQAEAQAFHDRQTRAMPDALFMLSQQRESMAAYCHSTLAAKGTLSEAQVESALGNIESFSQKLFGVSSEYLLDFSHKRLLKEMQSEFKPLADAVKDVRLAKQEARLSKEAAEIRRFCHELMNALDKMSRDDLIRKREAIYAFWQELRLASSNGSTRALDKIHAEFRCLIDDVNASTAWQIKCDEPNADAKARQKFAPLEPFSPNQLNDYLGAVDQAIALERKARSCDAMAGEFLLPALFWIVFAVCALSWVVPDWIFAYVVFIPPVLWGSGMLIRGWIRDGFAGHWRGKAANIYRQINTAYTNAQPEQLRKLRAIAGIEGRRWVVPYERWAEMLDLKPWKI